MQNDPYSVKILRPSAKVSPEPVIPTLVSEPELAPRCVFGVTLETLREDGQMVCGIPLVLRDMVQFLDKNGIFFFPVTRLLSFHSDPSIALSVHNSTDNTFCVLVTGIQYRGLFRLCGSVVRTKQLRQRWDSGERVNLEHEQDVPTVASLLKLFFRELPIPLVPDPQRKQLVLSLTGATKRIMTLYWTCIVYIISIFARLIYTALQQYKY